MLIELQQYLPFTVLKPEGPAFFYDQFHVATVPTVYGIETIKDYCNMVRHMLYVATVPTVYGIETFQCKL